MSYICEILCNKVLISNNGAKVIFIDDQINQIIQELLYWNIISSGKSINSNIIFFL